MQSCSCGKSRRERRLIICKYTEFWCPARQNFVLPVECQGLLMPQEGRAALCRNQEHPEKLIKTFPSDYTPEDGNRFLSRPSLTRLAQEECEGWVGSSPAGQWKEAAYRRPDCPARAAAAGSTSTQRGQLSRNISKAKAAYRKGGGRGSAFNNFLDRGTG